MHQRLEYKSIGCLLLLLVIMAMWSCKGETEASADLATTNVVARNDIGSPPAIEVNPVGFFESEGKLTGFVQVINHGEDSVFLVSLKGARSTDIPMIWGTKVIAPGRSTLVGWTSILMEARKIKSLEELFTEENSAVFSLTISFETKDKETFSMPSTMRTNCNYLIAEKEKFFSVCTNEKEVKTSSPPLDSLEVVANRMTFERKDGQIIAFITVKNKSSIGMELSVASDSPDIQTSWMCGIDLSKCPKQCWLPAGRTGVIATNFPVLDTKPVTDHLVNLKEVSSGKVVEIAIEL